MGRDSEKQKISQKRYKQSEKGKEIHHKACAKYRQSEKGKTVKKEYEQLGKRKVTDKKYRHAHKKQTREYTLKYKFNITLKQYGEMFEKQNGVCKICNGINESGRRLAVDHNHETNEIRGLLCTRCNLLVGNVENNVDLIKQILKYLRSGSSHH